MCSSDQLKSNLYGARHHAAVKTRQQANILRSGDMNKQTYVLRPYFTN